MYTLFIQESDVVTLQQQWLRLSFLENTLLPLAKKCAEELNIQSSVWLCHAWPVTPLEQQQESLLRLLWLTHIFESAGIKVLHELQLSTLQAAQKALGQVQTLSGVQTWWAQYVQENLKIKPVTILLGSDSYYEATRQNSHPLYEAHEVVEGQPMQVVPLMWAGEGNFLKCVPERYKQVLMADVRAPEKILNELPGLLEKFLGIGKQSTWKKAVQDYRALSEAQAPPHLSLSAHALKQVWQTYMTTHKNELDKRLGYCPVAVRVLLDGAWQQQRQRLVSHWQKNILSESLFKSSNQNNIAVGELPQVGEVVVVLGERGHGKRDYLVSAAQKAALAVHAYYQNGVRASQQETHTHLLGPSLPLWVDLAQYDPEDPDLLGAVLQRYGIASEKDRDFIKGYQPLLLLVDQFQEAEMQYNLYTHQNWREAHIALVVRCNAPYFSPEHPDVDYYFMPNDSQGLPLRHRLRYVTERLRSQSLEPVFIHAPETARRPSYRGSELADLASPSTALVLTAAEALHDTQMDRRLARRFVQRDRHLPVLQFLAQKFQSFPSYGRLQAFISYAWPKDPYACNALQQRLKQLVEDCALIGIHALLDIEQLQLGTDIKAFMKQGIEKSDVVFLIGTPDLVERVKFDEKDQPTTNAAFEFAEIRKKIQQGGRIFRLTYVSPSSTGNSPTSSDALEELPYPDYTRAWHRAVSPIFDLVSVDHYYHVLSDVWVSLLNLSEDLAAKELVEQYQSGYMEREASIQDADIEASIQRAREADLQAQRAAALAAEQAQAQRAQFESVLAAQLQLSRKERFERMVEGLRLNTEALQSHSFIAHTLKQYIPTHASTEAEPERARETAADLKSELDRLAAHSVTVLVGHSGSGKSLALHAHVKAAWERYDRDPHTQPLPIFISLPQYRISENWLTQVLEAAGCRTEEEHRIFREHHPALQVYCDGLDELPITALTEQRFSETFGDYTTTLIVSCRQEPLGQIEQVLKRPLLQYLLQGWALNGASSLQYYVTPFTSSQIASYLRAIVTLPGNACYQQDPRVLQQKIQAMPGLAQLIENPFALNLVCQALPRLEKLRGQKSDFEALKPVSRVEIFEAFLQEWFMKGLWRQVRRAGIYPVPPATLQWQRQAQKWAMTMLAHKATRLESDSAYRGTFATHAAIFRHVLPIREYQGQIAFIHKSVQECFIAQTYLEALNAVSLEATLTHWNQHPHLLQESGVLFFIKDQLRKNQESICWAMVEASKGRSKWSTAAALAITLLNYARVPFSGRDLSTICIPGADLSGAVCDATHFSGADLTGVRWKGAYLRDAQFGKSDWKESDLGDAPYWAAHRAGVTSLGVASETETMTIVSGSQDESWIIWRQGVVHKRCYAHASTVSHIAFHPAGTEIISAGLDGAVKHWLGGETIRCYWQNSQESIEAMTVDFARHMIFLGSNTMLCALDYQQVEQDTGGRSATRTNCFLQPRWQRRDEVVARRIQVLIGDPAQGMLIAGHAQGQITLLHAATGETVQTWSFTQESILCLALSTRGPWLAVGTQKGTVILWDTRQSMVLQQFVAHAGPVRSLSFHPQAASLSVLSLASAGEEGTVCLWSCSEGSRLNQWAAHQEAVTCVVFSPLGDQLISASLDRTIRVHTLTRQYQRHLDAIFQIPIVQLLALPQQPLVLTIDQAGHCIIWNADTGQRWKQWPGQLPPVRHVTVSPINAAVRLVTLDACGQPLSVGSSSGTDHAEIAPLLTTSLHTAATFSPSGQWLIVGDARGDIQILSSQLEESNAFSQAPIPAHAMPVTSMIWKLPDRLISADAGGTLMGWQWEEQGAAPQLRLRWTTAPRLTASGAEFATTLHLRADQIELLGQNGGNSPEMIRISLRAALLTHDVAQVQRGLMRYPELIFQPLEDQKTPWQLACQYSPAFVIEACLKTPGFGVAEARNTILAPEVTAAPENPLALALQDNTWASAYALCQALHFTLEELRSLSWQHARRQIPELTRALANVSTRWSGGNVIEYLLELGVDPDFPTPDGLTPLMHAAGSGCEPGARLLLQYGADLEIRDPGGNTALLHAATHGKTRLVEWLFEKGNAGAVIVNHAGEDALVRAARFGHAQTVHFLLGPHAKGLYDAHRAMQTVLDQGKAHPRYRPQTLLAVTVLSATLTVLNLSGSRLGAEGAVLLAQGLIHNVTLTVLDLHNNRLQTAGGKEIASILSTLAALQSLNLRSNYLQDEGASAVMSALQARAMQQHPAVVPLEHLDLRDNQVSGPVCVQLRETAMHLGITEYYDFYNDLDENFHEAFQPKIPTKENVGHLLSQTGMYQPRTGKERKSLLAPEEQARCRPTLGARPK